jgi:hypothetical protein
MTPADQRVTRGHAIASEIFLQLQGEAGARRDYEAFLASCPDLLPDDVAAIQEIQRDEANHMLTLQAMVRKYDGGLSASPDGAVAALQGIAAGIGHES